MKPPTFNAQPDVYLSQSDPTEMLQLRKSAKPIPGNNKGLIKLRAATITRGNGLLAAWDG